MGPQHLECGPDSRETAPLGPVQGRDPHHVVIQTFPVWTPSKSRTRERRLADGSTARMSNTDTVVDFDVALIERARKGDSRAFERLYRDHVGRVHGLCLRMTRNPELAADCAQDAFIKAWKALPRFEARSSFSTWLHRIAVNTVLERRRGGAAKAEILVEDPTEYSEPVLSFDTP